MYEEILAWFPRKVSGEGAERMRIPNLLPHTHVTEGQCCSDKKGTAHRLELNMDTTTVGLAGVDMYRLSGEEERALLVVGEIAGTSFFRHRKELSVT